METKVPMELILFLIRKLKVDLFDHQAKVRGSRIELDEVEKRSRVPSRDTWRRGGSACEPLGHLRLATYLAGDTENAPSVTDLRSFLQQKLPEHMIPASFVFPTRSWWMSLLRRESPNPMPTSRVVFNFQGNPNPQLQLPGLVLSQLSIATGGIKIRLHSIYEREVWTVKRDVRKTSVHELM